MTDGDTAKEFVQCVNHHFFDPKKYPACNFCGAGIAPVEEAADPALPDFLKVPSPSDPEPPTPVEVPRVARVDQIPVAPGPVKTVENPNLVKCANGHSYDSRTHTECPFCKTNRAPAKKRWGCLGTMALLLLIAAGAGVCLWIFEPQVSKLISEYKTDSARAGTPVIATFEAVPVQIQSGDGATLRWSVSNATKIEIDQGIGVVSGQQIDLRPTVSTKYTMTATGSAGIVIRDTWIIVQSKPAPPPIVDSFTADPPSFEKGQSVTLHWAVQNATTVTIDQGVGAVTGDTITVQPNDTTIYKLTASNGLFSTTSSIQVTLSTPSSSKQDRPPQPSPLQSPPTQPPSAPPQPASITSFTAAPAAIEKGQATVLRWSVQNATSLRIDPNVGSVTGDNIIVHPDVTTQYTLTASGSRPDSRSLTVVVSDPATRPPVSPTAPTKESGTLTCRGVSVPAHGEVFFNLPAGKLSFYNLQPANTWKLHLKRLPDGTQQLFMGSQLSTVQNYCSVNWELLFTLQVASVSNQSDASLLAAALKRRGYKVSTFSDAGALIHVQVGEPSTKKDGEALRLRLQADGYNSTFVTAP